MDKTNSPGKKDNRSSASPQIPKKRSRVRQPLSCSVCRKRKLKCDRARPCGTCIKKSIVHLCHYEDDNRPPINHFLPPEQQLHPTHIDNNGYIITDQLPPQPPPIHYQDPYNNHNHNHHFQQQQQHHHHNTNNDSNFDPSLLHIQANGHNQFQHQPLSSHSPQGNHQYLPIPPPPPPPPQLQQSQHPPSISPAGYNSLIKMSQAQISIPTPPPATKSSTSTSNHSSPNRPPTSSGQSSYHTTTTNNYSNFNSSTISNINSKPKLNSISLPLPPPPPPPSVTTPSLPMPSTTKSSIFGMSLHHDNTFGQVSIPSPIPPINELSPSLLRLKSLGSNSDGVLSPTTIGVNDLLNPSRSNGGYNQLDNTIPPPTHENSNPTAQSVLSDQTAPSSKSISSPQESESFSSNSLVSIPLGANSSLQINALDTMDVFTNAVFSLHSTGNEWQQLGTLSYLGLTKSDPFITILRNFTVHLFRSDEFLNVIRNDATRKRRNSNGSLISIRSSRTGDENLSPVATKRPKLDNNGNGNANGNGNGNSSASLNTVSMPMNRSNSNDSNYLSNNANFTDAFDMISENDKPSNNTPLETFSPLVQQQYESPKKTPGDMAFMQSFYNGEQKRQEYYRFVEDEVSKILPDKTNLFQLFCRYFRFVNPFIQIVDEHALLFDINPILPKFLKFNHEKFTEVKIKSENDLRTLGIFLLVLKLGYQTMIHNDNEHNNYNEQELSIIDSMQQLDNPTFNRIINLCIADGLITARSSFKLVQLLALLYHYKGMSPDDSHGLSSADSQILLGTIIRHAFSIGLNRDPTRYTTFDNLAKNQVLIKTWRHLWWFLVATDAMSALNTGCNLNVSSLDGCDVEYPHVSEDPTGEMNKIYEVLAKICEHYRNIVNKINNLRQKPKVVEILKETNQMERIFFDFFGKDFFKDVVCKPAKEPTNGNGFEEASKEHMEKVVKVFKYCLFIQLRTNLSGMYYKIAIHYENEYDKSKTPSMKAGIELFKIYIKSVVQLVYIMSYVLDNSVYLFGKNFDYMLTASNERYMIKTHSFLTSFFVRLLHQKKELSFKVFKEISYMSRLECINNLFDIVLEDVELFVGDFRRLSKTYINSYRLYIITFIVLRQSIDNSDAFFEKAASDQLFFHQGTNMIEFFSQQELNHLCRLCRDWRNIKEAQKKYKDAKKNAINTKDTDDNDNEEIGFDPLKELESKLFGSSFFDDDNIFSNLNNLSDEILDPVACKEDLIRLFNIYGDFNDLL